VTDHGIGLAAALLGSALRWGRRHSELVSVTL